MNKLIVESKNDKIFIEAFIRHLHIHAEVDTPICSIDEFSPTERLNLVTNSLNKALKNKDITQIEKGFEKTNQFISVPIDETITVEIACFFTN